ncbi:unnamed protein product [Caenorhabditis nigoni]
MFQLIVVIYFSMIKVLDSCIPTQNIETTTTTTTVATTTTTAFACSTCTNIYNTGCQGTGLPSASNWCVKEEDVPVQYSVETASFYVDYEFLTDEMACTTTLSCPSGTHSVFLVSGYGEEEGENYGLDPTTLYCPESGTSAGRWTSYLNGHEANGITQMTCKNN